MTDAYLDGVLMRLVSSGEQSVVSSETTIAFEHHGDVVSARYSGGEVREGYLIGHLAGNTLHFCCTQIARDGTVDAGMSVGNLERHENGLMRMIESYRWLTRPGVGSNVFEQIPNTLDVVTLWADSGDRTWDAQIVELVTTVVEDGGAVGFANPPNISDIDAWLHAFSQASERGDASMLLVTRNAKVIGMGTIGRGTAWNDRHIGTLNQIMCLKDVRRMGIGRIIVEKLVCRALKLGLEMLTLQIRGNNFGAIALYCNCGFYEWGRLPEGIDAAGVRFDDVRMVRRLERTRSKMAHPLVKAVAKSFIP